MNSTRAFIVPGARALAVLITAGFCCARAVEAVTCAPVTSLIEPVGEPPKPLAGAAAEQSVTFEHDGQTFVLANSTSRPNVDTAEYVLVGEKLAEWTQLITVQKITSAKPRRVDAFLAFFRKRLSTDGASLDVLKETKGAGVFVARFPASERNEEQVVMCLAFVEEATPSTLTVLQYAIKPNRFPVSVVEMRIRSWRDRLLMRAERPLVGSQI